MKLTSSLSGLVLLASVAAAGAASAATPGYVSRAATLRAGPAADYPSIGTVRRGSGVTIYGCLGGWDWCEVAAGPYRGWVVGDNLQAVYHRKRVRIIDSGPAIRVPVITFSVGDYWDEHYRSRPFYRDRDRWVSQHGGHDGPLPWHGDNHDNRDHDNRGNDHDDHRGDWNNGRH
jgi:uncharacterized protein YraI